MASTKNISFLSETITFDRFVRGLLVALLAVAMYHLLVSLQGVLIPFFIAWMLAYMLYPIVYFLERKCHLRYRLVSIALTVSVLLGLLSVALVLFIPPAVRQIESLSDDLLYYATTYLSGTDIPQRIETFLQQEVSRNNLVQLLSKEDIMEAVRIFWQQTWTVLSGTMNIVWLLVDIMMVGLYLLFFLLDYERVNRNWLQVIPQRHRKMANAIATDVKREMNAYFRGQATVAFLVGVLFSIGFIIIDLPMAVGLGIFIGILNMVPYAQTIGILPALLLALLKSNDTGENFWWIMFLLFIVFCVVQGLQDLFLVPRIMGKAMGLKPVIILLSLSVWGSLLGIIGFIIALPLTSLLWSYYKRFVLKEATSPIIPNQPNNEGCD